MCVFIVSSVALYLEHKKGSDASVGQVTDLPTGQAGLSLHRSLVLPIIGIVLCLVGWWQAILPLAITDSIRSPWLVVPTGILIAIALAGSLAYAISTKATWTPIVIAAILFSAVSIAMVVYPLGFGFDPFLHRATVAHIVEHGSITPKPLYYIGAYALEFGGTILFGWPLTLLDHLLLPLAGSLLLTASMWIGLTRMMKQSRTPGILAIFFFPLAALTVTTPQSLAYVITASLLFFSIARRSLPLLSLLAVFTLLIHPLAGIPAVLYTGILFLQTIQNIRVKKVLTTAAIALFSLAIPAVFLMQAVIGNLPIRFNPSGLTLESLHLSVFFRNGFHPFFDGLYLIINNTWWILFLLALWGWHRQMRASEDRLNDSLPILAAIACFASFLLMHTLSFDFLIEYERADYADRLLTLFAIFLIPHAGYALARIDEIMRTGQQRGMRVAWAGLLGCVIAAQTYGAYPRHDNYSRSAGFNVGQDAFSAVVSINEQANGEQYIALSDQSLSAAAVQSYGFAQYYHGDIFYYPIPTGGQMYQFYLDMTTEPTREIMDEAMDVAGVNTGFFAVNTYWWDSVRIIEHAKNEADDWYAIGDVTIFRFNK